jgi:hypothetical protein
MLTKATDPHFNGSSYLAPHASHNCCACCLCSSTPPAVVHAVSGVQRFAHVYSYLHYTAFDCILQHFMAINQLLFRAGLLSHLVTPTHAAALNS